MAIHRYNSLPKFCDGVTTIKSLNVGKPIRGQKNNC